MKPRISRFPRTVAVAFVSLAFLQLFWGLISPSPALAATATWDGGGADNNWTTPANWVGNVAPVAGDSLVFPAGAARQTTNSNNYASGTNFKSISFTGSGYILSGNSVSIGTGFGTNLSQTLGGAGPNTISFGISLAANTDVDVVDGLLTLSGAVSGAFHFTKNGAGTLKFSGSGGNTYSGLTTVNAGTLELSKNAGVPAVAGDLRVGDGNPVADADVLRLLASHQIANTSTVTVGGAGLFDLNGFSDTIGRLQFGNPSSLSPRVTTGAGLLGIDGQVNAFALNAPGLLQGRIDLGSSPHSFGISDGAAHPDLQIDAVITGSGGITMTGGGTVRLGGAEPNTHTGTWTINAGRVELAKSVANGAIAGNVQIGDGSGGQDADVLRLLADDQIANTSVVTMTSSGLFDLDGHSDQIDSLEFASATVTQPRVTTVSSTTSATGTLVVGNQVNVSAPSTTPLIQGGLGFTPAGTTAINVADGEAHPDLQIDAAITGSGGFTKTGAGELRLNGASPSFTGSTVLVSGRLRVSGSIGASDVTIAGGQLRDGNGAVKSITGVNGIVSPSGSMPVNGPVTLGTGITLNMFNLGSTSGGQLRVAGPVSLSGPSLDFETQTSNALPNIPIGSTFVIIENDGTDPVQGTFANLPEGAAITQGKFTARVSYQGGTGNDVTLTTLTPNCPRRPNVLVAVESVGAGLLQTIIQAQSVASVADNVIDLIRITPASNANASVTVPAQPGVTAPVTGTGSFAVAINPPQPSIRFTAQAQAAGPVTTIFDVSDRCGVWNSLSGGGAAVIGQLGTFSVDPASSVVRADESLKLRLNWLLPPDRAANELANVQLRLVDENHSPTIWVRWDEIQGTFNPVVIQSQARPFAEAPETHRAVADASNVEFALRLPAGYLAPGRTYTLEVRAEDDSGISRGFDRGGQLTVLPSNGPSSDDPRPRRLTPEQRQQEQRTDRSSRDDIHIEGNVLAVDWLSQPPAVTLGNRDGRVTVMLHCRTRCPTVREGDYLQAEGEKQHELLFDAYDVRVSPMR